MPKHIFAKEYEKYLISGKEEALNSLASGSIEKEYFVLIRKLLNEELSPRLQREIDYFVRRVPESQCYRLKALNIFKKLQNNPDKKDEIIKDIKKLFNLGSVKSYSKPVKYNKVSNDQNQKEDEKKLPNSLDINKYIKTKQFIEDIYSNEVDPEDMNIEDYFDYKSVKLNIDCNKLTEDLLVKAFTNKNNYSVFSDFVVKNITYLKLDKFKKVIKLIVEKCSKNEQSKKRFRELVLKEIDHFLNEQINVLLEYRNEFDFDELVSELISRKYYEETKDNLERVKKLKEIKKLLNENKFEEDKMTRNVLYSILYLNSKMNIFELDTFIEYLKCPIFENSSIYHIEKELKEKIKKNKNQKDIFHCQIIEPNYNEEVKLIKKCLKHFYLKEKIPFEKFNKYFYTDFITEFYSKMQFYLGKEEPLKDNTLSSYEIDNLMEETILTICEFNKESFNISDDIELILEVKNIKTLYLNIYEINTENYYYSNKKSFDETISLDGIVPTYEDIFSYNDKPQLLTEKKVLISKLPKKRGLFVVEFIGNGHVSRAVIQRGNLICIHKNTINGKVLYILDEENKICKGEKTGVWINNVWYPSIEKTGAILIPYSVKGDTFILKHEDFCCIEQSISIPNESYELSGLFIIDEESFLMGNVAKILVRPYLFVCNELCPLENLKNVKLTINSIKTENNQEIPSITVIDNIKLSYDKEFSFEFQVPAKLKYVNFTLSGEIKPKTRDNVETLNISQELHFNRNFEYDKLMKQDIDGNYILHFLGRNGEPKGNHQVELNINHKFQSIINKDKSILLESDLEGKINLGKLNDVEKLEIDKTSFEIEQFPKLTYMSSMTILENQQINLPFNKMEGYEIHFLRIKGTKIVENLSDSLNIKITDEKHNLGNIALPKLSEGIYKLVINDCDIIINVIKGKVMDIQDFVLTDSGNIRYNNNVETSIAIEKVSYENKELKIKLNKNNKSINNPRVHINCVQYLPKKLNKNLELFSQSKFYQFRMMNEEQEFNITKATNIYLNNKILSDEIQYVLDRKQYEINLGNSLEKPSLLLKPQFIRDTTTEIKEGREGEGFGRLNAKEKRGYPVESCCKKCKRRLEMEDTRIKVHDFINVSPLIEENLIPDENGEVIIKDIDLKEYSFLHILCFDNISCNEDCFCLKNGVTSLRDLRAVNDLELNKNYCELRKIYPLSKKDKHHINDITSTKFKLFDSLEKYVEFINIINPSLNKELKDFSFLLNFNNLNLNEKLEKITQYFSHETNIYLYFHHYDFFNKFIYPILKYKSEKTFIDYFLLDYKEKILEFTKLQKVKQLNTFEKCLLIYTIRKDNKKLACSLARQIRAQSPKENQSEIKRLFNIALNLKSIEETKEIENIKVQKNSLKRPDEFLAFEMPKKLCCKKIVPSYDVDDYFDVDDDIAERINEKSQLFKEQGKTKEYCETQYYNRVFKNSDSNSRVKPNHFFADLAKYWSENDSIRNIGFKTDNILTKPNNLTEIIFMLSVLDLEEKTLPQSQNLINDKGLGLTIEANTNAYLLTKEINETQLNTDNKYSLILAQMVFEADKANKSDEKEPTKFLINRTYLQKTIVTNISPDDITCEILMNIPEGSLPIDSDEYKIIETANIKNYKSVVFEQKFYFPQEGTFKVYPASASINGLIIAKSGLKTYEVVSNIKLSKEEISNIDDVLDQGNKKEVLEFIKKSEVIDEEDLRKIYWMLKEKDFYSQLINILKEKYLYDDDIWQFSIENDDIDSLKEYIHNHKDKEIFKSIGHEFDLQYLKVDKTNNAHILNHLDYYPILKNRIFKLPRSKSILTVQLRDTYQDYVSYLITLPKINDYQYMRLSYYLILQQRIKDATTVYNKIDKNKLIGNELSSLELQYDYLTAYLDFSNGYPKFEKARAISKKYKDISISSWKNMFNEIEDQLNEYDGKINYDKEINEEENASKKENKVKEEEVLNIELKDQDINIIYKNISEITVKYYLIDIEILFSRSPFVKKTKVDFGYVKPQRIDIIKVEKDSTENKHVLGIPDELKNKNFYIEVISGKKREKEIYNSSLLKYSIIESIGEIKVMTPELKPLSQVYIKCFCETNNGSIIFYKDGFTDLRGKFDYISLNNDLVNEVKTFSILMVSKDYGSIITTCSPPKMIKETNGENNIEAIFEYRQQLKNKLRNHS